MITDARGRVLCRVRGGVLRRLLAGVPHRPLGGALRDVLRPVAGLRLLAQSVAARPTPVAPAGGLPTVSGATVTGAGSFLLAAVGAGRSRHRRAVCRVLAPRGGVRDAGDVGAMVARARRAV